MVVVTHETLAITCIKKIYKQARALEIVLFWAEADEISSAFLISLDSMSVLYLGYVHDVGDGLLLLHGGEHYRRKIHLPHAA